MEFVLVIVLVSLTIADEEISFLDWYYDTQYTWGQEYKLCSEGVDQSPIDVRYPDASFDPDLDPLIIEQYTDQIDEDVSLLNIQVYPTNDMLMVNTGYSIKVKLNMDIFLHGAELGDKFKVCELNFHWGEDDSSGSEHMKNSHTFPMEMHIVSYDSKKYTSLTEAKGNYASIAIIAVFFQVAKKNNDNLNEIVSKLPRVLNEGEEIGVEVFQIDTLLPRNHNNYFRYNGSLTIPGCEESVIWTVMDMPNFISTKQIDKFRNSIEKNGKRISGNFREIQNIYYRKISRSFN